MAAGNAADADEAVVTSDHLTTNALDMDIASIEDKGVRRRIAAAFSRLRERAEYGLVFEKHKPESVVLHGQQVREDRYATLRTAPGPRNAFRVVEIDDGKATLQPVDEHFRPIGARSIEALDALVPLARFGDPIFPGLEQTGEILGAVDQEGNPTKPFHTVINGENFHALETLLYAYEGKVDCIYIDPPYNSGAKDWKYNNDYVDREDVYRHSRWLSFLEKRLKLAQRLLNPDESVLIVTIDEREVLRLGLLLEQIFKGRRIQMITSVINTKGSARKGGFSRVEEHLFFVFVGAAAAQPSSDNMLSVRIPEDDEGDEAAVEQLNRGTIWLSMLRRGSDARRVDREKQFFPIFVNEATKTIHSVGDPLLPVTAKRSTVKPPRGTVSVWPLRKNGNEGRWQIGRDQFIRALKEGTARLGRRAKSGQWAINYLNEGAKKRISSGEIEVMGKDDKGALILRWAPTGTAARAARSVWNRSSHDASTYGSTLLSKLMPDRSFPFPKSLYAVEDSLRFCVGANSDALVVDFFSGSGTTAHAVMRLNRQDGGRRRTVLVTNNEVAADEQDELRGRGLYPGDADWERFGICEYITKPRIAAAITGRTPQDEAIEGAYKFTDPFPMADGFEENARFFNLTYLDPETVEAKQSFGQIAHLLWLISGAEGPVIDEEPRSGWALPENAMYGVLFRNKGRAGFAESLATRAAASNPPKHVFIVADSTDEFHRSLEEVGADPAHTTRLYRSYLKNFRTNVVDLKDEL